MSAIKVLSFDLDDTLWPVRPVLIAAEKRTELFLRAHCPNLYTSFSPEEMMQRRVELWKARTDLHHQISKLRIESVKALLLEAGYSAADSERFSNEAFDIFIAARHEVDFFAGVENCLEELTQSYSLAVITNGNADIKQLSQGELFDFSVKAEDINCSKPDALPFEKTLQHFAIEPEQMLHIGDHPQHDVGGAQALGIKTVWVNAEEQAWQEGQPADAEISCVADLPLALEALKINWPDV